MSHHTTTSDDHLEPVDEIAEAAEAPASHPQSRTSIGPFSGWGISAAIHVGAIALAAAAVFAAPPKDVDTPPFRPNTLNVPKSEVVKPRTDHSPEAQFIVDVTELPETNKVEVFTKMVIPTEPPQEIEPEVSIQKGHIDAISDFETGGQGAFMAIGSGGGGGSKFSARTSSNDKKIAIQKGHGTPGSENAVNVSLQWFMHHQSPNGSWEYINYYKNCSDGARCEPGELKDPKEEKTYNLAMTGYGVLCYLGAGYDHKIPNTYKSVVKKGLAFLVNAQEKGTGQLDRQNYAHAIATMALAEAYGMTSDVNLRDPAQKAVNYILAHQNQDTSKGGLGWDYVGPSARNDASVTGWNVMALKSAMIANLNVGNGMQGAKAWLEKSWRASNSPELVKAGVAFKEAASMTATDKSRFAYDWRTGATTLPLEAEDPKDPKSPKEVKGMHPKPNSGGQSLECVGLVCSVFLGHNAGDPLIESLANTVMAHQMPTKYPCNTYYMYYNTMAMFQVSGERWKTWNNVVRDMLVNAQRRTSDCMDGSWDKSGGNSRLFSTALNTLSLEVYYRYAQMQKHK